MDLIPLTTVSVNAYDLFDDLSFAMLLRSRGVDLNRDIVFKVGEWSVSVFYKDENGSST